MSVDDDPRPPRHPGAGLQGPLVVGLIMDTHVPVVAANNQAAEIAGLSGRILLPTPELTRPDWLDPAFRLFFKSGPTSLKGVKTRLTPHLFERWNRRYPAALQARNVAAAKEGEGGFRKSYNRISAFVKVEKSSGKGTLAGVAPVVPRIISGPSDVNKAMLGPNMWDLSNKIAQVYDGREGRPFFARGASAERLGEWAKEAVDSGKSAILEADAPKYDAHFCSDIMKKFRWLYCSLGVDEEIVDYISAHGTVGTTRHGVSFKTSESKLPSGRADTTLTGSLMNILLMWTFFTWHLKLTPAMFTFVVQGDDNLAFVEPFLNYKTALLEYDAWCLNFGFRMESMVFDDIAHASFCSKLFWPIAEGKWVLGAKPGRALEKLGVELSAAGVKSYKGTLLGARQDNNHVPFLRVAIQFSLSLCGSKAKVAPKSEEHQFHTARMYEVCDETWRFVHARYGYTREDEAEWAAVLSGITALPCVIPTGRLSRLFEVDLK